MTLRDEITAKIASLKAQVAELEDHLAKGGNVIDQDFDAAKAWLEGVVASIRKEL